MNKTELRLEIKQKLKQLSISEYSDLCRSLTHQVIKFLKSQSNQSQVVASFFPMKSEVAPDPLKLQTECPNFTWVFPLEVDGKMKFAETSGELVTGPWITNPGKIHTPQLVLMPGLAFDKQGNRLGRGRSFYDQFLAAHTNVTRIAVAWSGQIVDHVPVEEHDQRVDEIITELGRL